MSKFNNIEEAIGKIVGTDLVIAKNGIDETGRSMVKVQCTVCNKFRDLRWDKFNFGTARKCDCKKSAGQKINVGDIIGNDKVIGEGRKSNRPSLILQCILCGKVRNVERYKFGSGRVDKCTCDKSGKVDYKNKYKYLIGKTDSNFNFEILDVLSKIEYTQGNGYLGIQLKVKCLKCGREYTVKAAPYLRGDTKFVEHCICNEKSQPSNRIHDDNELGKILKEKYKYMIGEKSGKLTVVDIVAKESKTYCRCICECNSKTQNIIDVVLSNIKNKRVKSCGCISVSYGENIIGQLLDSLHINYGKEATYEDLKSPRNYSLRYDFIVHGDNKDILIEYNGIQHYSTESFKGNDKYTLEYRQLCDNIKIKYAKDNNIPLLIIKNTQDKDMIKQEVLNFLHEESII